jgi:FlaA1/EpsC-like NDP-sugar epimerase
VRQNRRLVTRLAGARINAAILAQEVEAWLAAERGWSEVKMPPLSSIATGRTTSLFQEDLALRREEIARGVAGSRILLVGGGGSIGSATVHALIPFRPGELVIVDTDENSLAELVRDLRGSWAESRLPRLVMLPIEYGSEIFHRLLRERAPFDLVLNFAALKHVRSEKDTCAVLQMLDTNVIKVTRLMRWLGEAQGDARFFSVSTDKAADPVNLMGASKQVMEQVVFSRAFRPGRRGHVTSARFANVAFSDGSLLFGWLQRIVKGQPIACPERARRYFVSLEEAGQICLIAGASAGDGQVIVPELDAGRDLVDLATVARKFIAHNGFTPKEYRDEDAAKAHLKEDVAAGAYPLLLTPLDTDGEKTFEEFVADGERAEAIGLPHLKAVVPPAVPEAGLRAFLARLERALVDSAAPADKGEIVAALTELVPQFRHAQTGRSLDDRF